jgi:hypothetical protein
MKQSALYSLRILLVVGLFINLVSAANNTSDQLPQEMKREAETRLSSIAKETKTALDMSRLEYSMAGSTLVATAQVQQESIKDGSVIALLYVSKTIGVRKHTRIGPGAYLMRIKGDPKDSGARIEIVDSRNRAVAEMDANCRNCKSKAPHGVEFVKTSAEDGCYGYWGARLETKTKCIGVVFLCNDVCIDHRGAEVASSGWYICGPCFGFKW